jgi:pilus assembly protein CpaE
VQWAISVAYLRIFKGYDMSGAKDMFHTDSDLDSLALDLDLDMDQPIGATFAAALRDQGAAPDLGSGGKDGLAGLLGGDFSDDGFMKPHVGTVAAPRSGSDDASMGPSDFGLGGGPEDAEDAAFAIEDEEHLPPVRSPYAAALLHKSEPILDPGFFAAQAGQAGRPGLMLEPEFEPEPEFDPEPEYMLNFHPEPAQADEVVDENDAELSEIPDEMPPLNSSHAGEIHDDHGAGAGLGFDYAFSTADGGDRMVPRIAAHAFCMRTQLLGLMRTVMNDRRMKNVSMEVFEGGVPAAIAHYVNETTPNLIIIEAATDPRQLLAELDSLAEYCDENIRVVVIGHHNDIRLYRELMRRGVSEYLVAPIEPLQMVRAIGGLFADPESPFTGKTLAVTGVKGGVGASSIAHNLAWALAERFKINSTLIDLDLNFGTTGLDFNEDAGATIADALLSPDRFDDNVMSRLITKATDRLSLFTAPATLDRTYDLDPETYEKVLEQVRKSVPYIVLDMPHIWTDWFKSTIVGADEVVIVASPDLASLRNGKNMIDFLKAARPNDQPPRLVLNMVGLPKRPEIPAKDFGQAIGLTPALILPFDAQLFGTAANNGQMIFDVGPDSKVAQSIDQLAGMLTGREVQAEKSSMLKKLLGR